MFNNFVKRVKKKKRKKEKEEKEKAGEKNESLLPLKFKYTRQMQPLFFLSG